MVLLDGPLSQDWREQFLLELVNHILRELVVDPLGPVFESPQHHSEGDALMRQEEPLLGLDLQLLLVILDVDLCLDFIINSLGQKGLHLRYLH